MKKYLLFIVQRYYPDGGWYDFKNDFDTIDEAVKYLEIEIKDGDELSAHIVNSENKKVIKGLSLNYIVEDDIMKWVDYAV